jgi:hypothetical protein
MVMSAAAVSARPTDLGQIDRAVEAVAARSVDFAKLPVAEKARLLHSIPARVRARAPAWVAAGCRAKGIDPSSGLAAEEWLVGPLITARAARLMGETLQQIAGGGRPPLGTGHRVRPDGRLEVGVFPTSRLDAVLFSGYAAQVLMAPGMTPDEARRRQASFYAGTAHAGRVSAILGAGNVSSIPPTDVFTKMFAEGCVAVLKMNPVNEWLGPVLEEVLDPLIAPGYLRIVYGGGDAGAHLVQHQRVDDVHITGSAATYDAVRRQVPGKTVSAELGNVSPVIVVPHEYRERELWFQAKALATMVVNNASFNCNAAKMLVTSRAWSQRDQFLRLVRRALAEVPTRVAYYPGAFDRYERLLAGHENVERLGSGDSQRLPWTFVTDLDPEDAREDLFSVEPFCGILSETALEAGSPAQFLTAATRFCNERLWGTLNATVVAPPGLAPEALETAIRDLRYGTVGVNVWPGVAYALVSPPWGGHPSATPGDIQSGRYWVHNSYLLEGIEKSVIRGPLAAPLKPAWSYDAHRTVKMAPRLVDFEVSPSWAKVPALALLALRQ